MTMRDEGPPDREANMRRSSSGTLAACVCLVALSSVQCSQDVGGKETDGPTLTIHSPGADERSLGPYGPNMGLVFLYMADGSEDDDDPKPRLLDRWEHTPDYTEWTVHVREGLLWDDGVPVTAEDVKFGLELWTHPDVLYENRFFDSITVLDSHTLRITFPDPPETTIWIYDWMPMVHPRHLLDTLEPARVHDWPFWIQPVGNGPYRYVRHTPNIMTELEVNPSYYGEEPKIPRIVLRYGGNAVTELLSENVDIAGRISAMDAMRLAGDPRFRIYHDVRYSTVAIVWNHRNPLFRDADVRRALTMSIDRRELHRVLNYPDDVPIVDVFARKRHHVEGVVPDPLPFDRERADRLFAGAGWVDTDGDGILDKDGRAFEFTLITTGETTSEAVYVQDQLRRAGIRMDISTYARNVLRQSMEEPYDFDAAMVRTLNNGHVGPDRATGYDNPAYNQIREARDTLDPAETDRRARATWRILSPDIPVTHLHLGVNYRAAHRRVRGMQNDTPWRVEDLWIDDEGGTDGPS